MKLLITGGAGFIGSNFIRYMLSAHPEYEIINLDKLTYAGNLESLKDVAPSPNYRFIKGDIGDSGMLKEIAYDAVVNFAAESHVDRSILDAQPFLQTNVLGTYVLLESARQRGCVFLHVSTDEVYGSAEAGLFHEDSPLMPNSPYAASKAASDLLVRSYVETHKLNAMITRCSNNYGPFQFPEKLIPLVLMNAMNGKRIPVYGDGLNVRDWIYVTDHCRAIDMVLHKGRPGEIYNVGARNECQNIHLVRMLLKKLAGRLGVDERELLGLIQYVEDRKGHDRRYAIDPSKVEKQTGWKPETGFEEGLTETIDWYLANKPWIERVLSGEYMQYYKEQYGERLKP